jgi:hypothetical protein
LLPWIWFGELLSLSSKQNLKNVLWTWGVIAALLLVLWTWGVITVLLLVLWKWGVITALLQVLWTWGEITALLLVLWKWGVIPALLLVLWTWGLITALLLVLWTWGLITALFLEESMFQVPWPPEIGARVLSKQHKVYFQHSAFLLLTYCRCLFKVCVENFQNLERSMSYAFSIVYRYVCKLGGQNGCACRTQNIESITPALCECLLKDTHMKQIPEPQHPVVQTSTLLTPILSLCSSTASSLHRLATSASPW